MPPRSQVLFDLDGPILDGRIRYWKAYREALIRSARQPPVPLTADEYWEAKRNRVPETDLLQRTGVEVDVGVYRAWRHRLLEDPETLRADRVWPWGHHVLGLLSQTCDLFLVTVRRRPSSMMAQLEDLGLDRFFKRILVEPENDGTYLVKGRLIRTCAEVCLHDVVICGDTEVDILVGQTLSIPTVAVSCGIRTPEYLSSLQPTFLVDDIRAVPGIVGAAG